MAARGRACGSSEPSMREAGRPGPAGACVCRSPSPRGAVAIAGRLRSELGWRGRPVEPQGPRRWACLARAVEPWAPRPAQVRPGGGRGVRGRSRPERPLSVEAGECRAPRAGRRARGQGGRRSGGARVAVAPRVRPAVPGRAPSRRRDPHPQPGVVNGFSSGAFCSRFRVGDGVTESRSFSPSPDHEHFRLYLFLRLLGIFKYLFYISAYIGGV